VVCSYKLHCQISVSVEDFDARIQKVTYLVLASLPPLDSTDTWKSRQSELRWWCYKKSSYQLKLHVQFFRFQRSYTVDPKTIK